MAYPAKGWHGQQTLLPDTGTNSPATIAITIKLFATLAGNTHQIYECLFSLDSNVKCCITIYVCFAKYSMSWLLHFDLPVHCIKAVIAAITRITDQEIMYEQARTNYCS